MLKASVWLNKRLFATEKKSLLSNNTDPAILKKSDIVELHKMKDGVLLTTDGILTI